MISEAYTMYLCRVQLGKGWGVQEGRRGEGLRKTRAKFQVNEGRGLKSLVD